MLNSKPCQKCARVPRMRCYRTVQTHGSHCTQDKLRETVWNELEIGPKRFVSRLFSLLMINRPALKLTPFSCLLHG